MKKYYQIIIAIIGALLLQFIYPLAKINLILPFLMDVPVTLLLNNGFVSDIVTQYKKQGSFAFSKNKSIRRNCLYIFLFLLFLWVMTFVIIKLKLS